MTTCNDCGREIGELEVFPKGRCLGCHEGDPAVQREIETMTGEKLAAMWGSDVLRATANAEASVEAERDEMEADYADLLTIAQGNALPARVENDLEARGLIVQTDQPYANLTEQGSALLTEAGETVYVCENGHRFVKAMRRYADVYCPTCGSHEVGRDGEA